MKRLLYVAVSAIGLGAVVLAQKLIGRKANNQSKSPRSKNRSASDGNKEEIDRARLSNMSVKKDGSLDMRHKENKEAMRRGDVATHTTVHLKKNGEPDRRYKENRDR